MAWVLAAFSSRVYIHNYVCVDTYIYTIYLYTYIYRARTILQLALVLAICS